MAAKPRLAIGLIVALLVLVADQVSKWLVLHRVFELPTPISAELWHAPIVVTDFLNLVMVWNRGVSFGLFSDSPDIMRWVLLGLSVVIAVALVLWLRQTQRLLIGLSIGLILGGALGNAIDRLRFGAVADFIDFHVAGWHWWAFNLADAGISIGVVLLVFDSFFGGRKGADAGPTTP